MNAAHHHALTGDLPALAGSHQGKTGAVSALPERQGVAQVIGQQVADLS